MYIPNKDLVARDEGTTRVCVYSDNLLTREKGPWRFRQEDQNIAKVSSQAYRYKLGPPTQ